MRFWALALLTLLSTQAFAHSDMLTFPVAQDGRQVIAIDLHTHSAFSDGRVWPSLRAEEATRDGLGAIAITEHLEWQPHAQDIPHADRNRPFYIARKAAADSGLLIINGAEISRGPGIGHINAVFITDANRLLIADKPSASQGFDLEVRFQGTDQAMQDEALSVVREAKNQGAFLFLNHPSWTGQSLDGRATLSPFQRNLVTQGLLNGIEVASSGHYSADAFRLALEHELVILGSSDVHGLTAWDYADAHQPLVPGSQGARTVTLLLSRDRSVAALREALYSGQTAALSNNQLFGRSEQLLPLIAASLHFSIGPRAQSFVGLSQVYTVTFHNALPIPLQLRNISPWVFANSANTFTVPPRGTHALRIAQLRDPAKLSTIKVATLNAFTAPETPLEITIKQRPSLGL